MDTTNGRPAPYRIDSPVHQIQTIEWNGDVGFLLRHDLTRLDASNFDLLVAREKATIRRSEQVGKSGRRIKFNDLPANQALYKAIVQGGGWRPASLEPYKDDALIPAAARALYSFDEESQSFVPGWNEITREQAQRLTQEVMTRAIQSYERCKGEYVPDADEGFMFEKAAILRIRLSLGDHDNPAFKLLLQMRRPETASRSRFRNDFAYTLQRRQGEMQIGDTKIDLRQAISVFDEHFVSVVDDSQHSVVTFGESGEPYTDARRGDFLSTLHPMLKVEASAALAGAFEKAELE